MSSSNPLGFGEKFSQLNRKEEGKSKEVMAAEREQKNLVLEALRDNQAYIEGLWQNAMKNRKKLFTLKFDQDISGGILTDIDTTTVIRRWVFETYENQLGLEMYHRDQIHFRIAE